MKSRRKLETE